jgi:hypothetical protein
LFIGKAPNKKNHSELNEKIFTNTTKIVEAATKFPIGLTGREICEKSRHLSSNTAIHVLGFKDSNSLLTGKLNFMASLSPKMTCSFTDMIKNPI